MQHSKRFWQVFFSFCSSLPCAVAWLCPPWPPRARRTADAGGSLLPGEVVISEFRVRGQNGGNDEFIELYNRTTSVKVIGGLEIWGSTSAGVLTNKATVPGALLLKSGQYYLITNANNANGPYSGAVGGNLTFSSGIADNGGIAFNRALGTPIIDQVGMTNCVGCYFETAPVTSLGATPNLDSGYERRAGGASDSCRILTIIRLIFNSSPRATRRIYFSVNLCGVPPPPLHRQTPLPIQERQQTQQLGRACHWSPTNTGIATKIHTFSFCPSRNVVISEFRPTGPNGGNDEFVELYNRSGSPVAIGNWVVRRSSAAEPLLL